MRPKKLKSDLINSSEEEIIPSKRFKSNKPTKNEEAAKLRKITKNLVIDNSGRESVKKALKENDGKILIEKQNEPIVNNESTNDENKSVGNENNECTNIKNENKVVIVPQLPCTHCHKLFKSNGGLRKHENTCKLNKNITIENESSTLEINGDLNNKTNVTESDDQQVSSQKKNLDRIVDELDKTCKKIELDITNKSKLSKKSELIVVGLGDADNMEIVVDVGAAEKDVTSINKLNPLFQCPFCCKKLKTSSGLSRHEINCKLNKSMAIKNESSALEINGELNNETNDSESDDKHVSLKNFTDRIVDELDKTYKKMKLNIMRERKLSQKPELILFGCNSDNSEIIEDVGAVEEVVSSMNRLDSLPQCAHCNKTFKTSMGVKRHERKCNKNFVEINKSPLSSIKEGETEGEISVSSVLDKRNSLPIIDNSENLKNIEVIEMNKSNEAEPPHCRHCYKMFKTQLGVRRHEFYCKKKSRDTIGSTQFEVEEKEMLSLLHPAANSSDPLAENGDITLNGSANKCQCCGEDAETAHLVGDFECNECHKLFKLKSSVERHIRVVHIGESHVCPQCGAKCPDKGTLARHMYTHTGLKPYSCPVCKQEFSRKYHLVRHNMQTGCDGKEKPVYPCQVCGREFNRKDNLREHLRAHAGQTKRKKRVTCDICGEEVEVSELLKHKRIHLGEKMYSCDFCSKKSNSSGAMKKHRRTHTGEKPYQCPTCDKEFAAKETLNRHVRIHTGFKPHCCQYCGKSFIQSSQLKSHLYYHTGPSVLQSSSEAYVCDLCNKRFNRRARLNEHIKFIHLGAKPFECLHCKKKFIRKEDFNRHLIIHSGVKAHQCPICSKSFAMKSTLKVHLLTHTKEPPRSCDACGRAFIRQDCLLRHMRSRHREMLEEIKTEAEKKKLQQQLLQVAAEASLVEGMDEREELDENGLIEAVKELLTLLVDESTLKDLGWPEAGVEALLEAVIKRCGHEPAPSSTPRHDRLRHNIKLLFTVVIDDSAVKALLNNQTVDEVILHVLRLAKS